MTSIAVAVGEIGVHEQALAANVQDTVSFAVRSKALQRQARVVNVDGAGSLFFTVDGVDVDLAATRAAHWLPAVAGASKTVSVTFTDDTPGVDDAIVVKLKSAAAVTYSVEVG